MGLDTYHQKRDFAKTPEPKGSQPKSGNADGRGFVIQKHAARALHYDFRLEVDGVLKSWAVPKGPSLNPKDKRLAMETEDHPVDYAAFEGVIPKPNYGAGTVMLWDAGEWQPEGDPRKALAAGKLNFVLRGERLNGHWSLVKMKGGKRSGKEWLLVKKNDEFADSGTDPTAEFTESVATGRTMKHIAQDGGAKSSDKKPRAKSSAGRSASKTGSAKSKTGGKKKAEKEAGAIDSALDDMQQPDKGKPGPRKAASATKSRLKKLTGAVEKTFPKNLTPQLATLYKTVPESDDWLHEIKFDGYRLLVMKGREISLITRNGNNWTEKFPALARALEQLPECIVDGELVYLNNKGVSSFGGLQRILKTGDTASLAFYAFDLPYLQGYDLAKVPLLERKKLLADIVLKLYQPQIKYSDHIQGAGADVFRQACEHQLEGIVSKKADSHYQSTRAKSWRKIKCGKRQEFVIVGFTEPGGSRAGFGALLLGYYEKNKLHYAGKVGTGFNTAQLRDMRKKLDGLKWDKSPLAEKIAEKKVHWVKPELVGEVEFTEWTRDNHLRHPSFVALRSDKPARQIVRETPVDTSSEQKQPVATVSNPDKILYDKAGITKQDLADYYQFIAPSMLPYIQRRPLTLVRCPHGHTGHCFFQKHLNENAGKWLKPIAIAEKKGTSNYPYLTDAKGLNDLVQLGTLEIHAWGSTIDNVEKPDVLVFDLDPDEGVSWDELKLASVELREFLKQLGLTSFVRTSGGKGLHVVVPVKPTQEWDDAKAFCKAVAQKMADNQPNRYVAVMSKAKRKNKIFVDYLRNGRGATAICNYSTRGKPYAPVATPLEWNELIELESAQTYRIDNIRERMESLKKDPWEGFFDIKQAVTKKVFDKIK